MSGEGDHLADTHVVRHPLESEGMIEGLVVAGRPPLVLTHTVQRQLADGRVEILGTTHICFVPPIGTSRDDTIVWTHEPNDHHVRFETNTGAPLGEATRYFVTAEQALRIGERVRQLTGLNLTERMEIIEGPRVI